QHFFTKFAAEKSPRLLGFSSRAMRAMEGHAWPGNVRELINRVRRAMVMAEGRLVTIADLGLQQRAELEFGEALGEARISAERHAITAGLHRAQKNVSQTARDLGVSRMTLYRLMAKHDINV
ncbi:MAG: helix-turn-helix domain-containing protein, partial [Burkholderiaceae bacterium]